MTEASPNILEVHDLSVRFDTGRSSVLAVDKVSFQLGAGKTLGILGESGSGKSVTAAAIMGLIESPPGHIVGGQILYRGQDLLTMPPKERRALAGSKISMIFQDPLAALNPVFTVGWQIGEMFRQRGFSARESRERTLALLQRVGIREPAQRINSYPHQLSGGQRQRVVIAMAVALGPDLLIADEPTTALDVTVQAKIIALLRSLQAEEGMSILFITHDLPLVSQVADGLVVMNGGRVVEQGPVSQVLSAPRDAYTRQLLAAIPGQGEIAEPVAATASAPVLEARDIVKSYGALAGGAPLVRAVDCVSFSLQKGAVLGIIGESGSGKTTLARTLLGLESVTAGQFLFHGRDIKAMSGRDKADLKRKIQVVFQDPSASLNPTMRIFDIVSEPWAIHKDVLPRNRWPDEVARLLESVRLSPDLASRYPHQLSGGQKQRIAIARALALRPEILVCDEALSALDVSVQAQIVDLLRDLRAKLDLSYIFIAHDLGVVRDFCDEILVMYQGKAVEQGSCKALFEAPRHAYTKQLIAANPVLELG